MVGLGKSNKSQLKYQLAVNAMKSENDAMGQEVAEC